MEKLSSKVTQHLVKFYEHDEFYGEKFDGFGSLEKLVPTVRKMIRMNAFISDVNEFRIVEYWGDEPVVHHEVMSINDEYRFNESVKCKSCSEKYDDCGCLEFEAISNESGTWVKTPEDADLLNQTLDKIEELFKEPDDA